MKSWVFALIFNSIGTFFVNCNPVELLINEIQLGNEGFIELISKTDMDQHQNNLVPFENYRLIICKNKPNEVPMIDAIINLSKFAFTKVHKP